LRRHAHKEQRVAVRALERRKYYRISDRASIARLVGELHLDTTTRLAIKWNGGATLKRGPCDWLQFVTKAGGHEMALLRKPYRACGKQSMPPEWFDPELYKNKGGHAGRLSLTTEASGHLGIIDILFGLLFAFLGLLG
jgi:hypothetical protein